MTDKNTFLYSLFLCIIANLLNAQSINIDDTKNAIDLVKILTNNSACLNVSGENTKGDTTIPVKNSFGSFDNNGGSFPLTNGIVLSTWASKNSIGPFTRIQGGGTTLWKGDADLDAALGIASVNATVLEFDFTPLTNFISFNYIFASNEYQDNYPCRFSDGFAFLIREFDSTTYKNIAVLPGQIPVSSINVRPLIPALTPPYPLGLNGCAAKNESYFDRLNTSPTYTSPINYSGQTKILNAQTAVIAGKKYHIKLVIADDVIDTYDSAVFIEGGSFSSKIDLGQDQLIATNNPICFGEAITLNTNLPGLHQWTRTDSNGTTLLPETSSSLVIQEAGVYKVETTVAAGCTVTGIIKIEYATEILLKDTSLIKCDDNGAAFFDLTKAEATIKNGDSSLISIEYYETQTGTVLSDRITNPTSFIKTGLTDQKVYVKVTSKTYGCTETATINLQTITSIKSSTILLTIPIVNNFSGNANSVQLIPPSITGTYDYSLDGKNYQSSPFFTGLAVGNYTAYIRDYGTCEYLTFPITILDYPRFFTPNGDGFNDLWKINNLEIYPNATITIYDRYGKLLKQLNANNSGWNGTFNGNLLPATDYWFNLKINSEKEIKGHFSLKR
ncbi:T9SS type B sorting domain-containing protein [Flavobacterium sp. K5-23]|uniref:T9SS type B sorting domain-containing protein n=1 Tax=Flavobacterium sp. K5-23 TaxID=2746225 RepID=UPI002010B0CE|nr:T9SS type B sorting domain-containing protein [Flavobacterium sp. K5-23]UQD57431.1 T9SS type B sorting domain-containing protein [Flavobacterium sp. K5-23]